MYNTNIKGLDKKKMLKKKQMIVNQLLIMLQIQKLEKVK